ncbi:hypothetical protein K2173_014377 [Erythroxylum novogranatense]|uniref:MRN complex-interacting protein N-terminal domain-containing protein n=1 Tax=Erythroxylum novogranatense TaxID=1862640 RepID=A0AAV8S6B9_9ROSI|nr:hypothetical protein K2173_014377 [Erythroxylum novogranatense]
MATSFIAVQCFQCSTMQVKQQRKNGNKWTCVICNHKQSIRKVFAKGHMAKDLRLFVQSFNMSRNVDHGQHWPPECNGGLFDDRGKKRTVWSEYLAGEEDNFTQHGEQADEMGPKVVTELPQQMFKRPKTKLNNCVSASSSGDGEGLDKPVSQKKGNTSRDELPPADVESVPKWSDYIIRDEGSRDSCLPTANKASKWNQYLNQDDDVLIQGSGKICADDLGQGSSDVWETILDDQKVEDDIHPDYM